MAISEKMVHFATSSSWIRKMFEKGASLKATYGADNVCDFSLGNPDVPPPERFSEVLRELAAEALHEIDIARRDRWVAHGKQHELRLEGEPRGLLPGRREVLLDELRRRIQGDGCPCASEERSK